jgi:guanylate kinase
MMIPAWRPDKAMNIEKPEFAKYVEQLAEVSGVNITKFYGERAMSLFIQPPSVEELRRRLEGRGTDTQEAIENRLAKAEYELTFAPQFDHVVVNDCLDEAKAETLRLVKQFLNIV